MNLGPPTPPPLPRLRPFPLWRHRVYITRELARSALSRHSGKRILFSGWPDIESGLRRSFRFSGHTVDFGPIPRRGGDYDAVIPLSLPAIAIAEEDAVLRGRNPLPIPSAAAVKLCDDKAALNRRLAEAGFGSHVPGPPQRGRFPYIIKRRHDACARNAHRIDGPGDEDRYSALLRSPDYLSQEWVEGSREFTTHFLIIDRKIRRTVTIAYEMAGRAAIRGQDAINGWGLCQTRHRDVFERMLNAVGFEGLGCFNFKLRGGAPIVMEINPRFGFSLVHYFFSFVRSLDWSR